MVARPVKPRCAHCSTVLTCPCCARQLSLYTKSGAITVRARHTDPATAHAAAAELNGKERKLAQSVATAVTILKGAGRPLSDFELAERWPAHWPGPFSNSLPAKGRLWACERGLVRHAGYGIHNRRTVMTWTAV